MAAAAPAASSPCTTPKRLRTSAAADDDGDMESTATPSRSFLEGLLAENTATTQAAINAAASAQQATLGQLGRFYDKQFTRIDKDISEIKAKQEATALGQQDMRESIGRLESALLLAESASRGAPPGGSSAARAAAPAEIEPKQADASILRINTSSLVPFAELRARLDALCAAAKIEAADYEFSGPPTLGQRFSLAFRGEPGLAARRAKKVQQSLRNADGSWSRITLTSPAGDPIEVFIGPDKTRATLTKERGTKAIGKLLREDYPDTTFTTVKRENGVAIEWALLVHVTLATGSRQPTLVWNTALAVQKDIDTDAIDTKFASLFAPREAPPLG
jgi:hypothetical protein